MFGGKFTHHNFARGLQNLKGHITSGYNHTKNFLGNVDNAYRTVRTGLAPDLFVPPSQPPPNSLKIPKPSLTLKKSQAWKPTPK